MLFVVCFGFSLTVVKTTDCGINKTDMCTDMCTLSDWEVKHFHLV